MNPSDKEHVTNPNGGTKISNEIPVQPLVSIGIPTYNRPDGLRVTLQCLMGQTYPNLEIIVSDNASPGDQIEKLVQEFMATDPRIQYVRQSKNIGIIKNFQFVLEKATGEFFMWAADDDEWDSSFVDFCLKNIGDSGSIMTAFAVKNRSLNNITMLSLPPMSGGKRCRADISAFVKNMQPSMFYGLHRRHLLSFFLRQKAFDWMDCYVCLRLIWHSGYVCKNEVCLYTAGIDAKKYVVKPFAGNRLNPLHYFVCSMKYIILSGNIVTIGRHIAFIFLPYIRFIFPKR